MNKLKKFWVIFLSFIPLSAGAAIPLVVGAISFVTVIAGFSIYRSVAPVNMADAFKFFSSCWTCQMFAEILSTMSNLVPRIYDAAGSVILPFAAVLIAIWLVWYIISGFLNSKTNDAMISVGDLANKFIKFAVIAGLLSVPVPRLLTNIVIEPVFNIGVALNRAVSGNDNFAECVVATAMVDPMVSDESAAEYGAFSPRLRHNLTCEIANVHQMTGLGMTVGWTILNMAFNDEYEHKILWGIPIFPNVPFFFLGLAILVLFFFALLPVPLYFLEVFIKLSMDLIMLPFIFLSWLFEGWPIFPKGKKNLKKIIDDVIQSTCGIAMVGVFVTFSVMFLNAVFGKWEGADRLALALQGDSTILMDGLVMRNDSVITVILMGIFITMFMTMIPQLVKSLFSKVEIPASLYESTKKHLDTTWKNLKKIYGSLKK